MKVGILGLSGVGKSYLVKEYLHNDKKYVGIKASVLIAQAKQTIALNKLTTTIIDNNQYALTEGFKAFCNENENVIIELHNIIETQECIVDISDDILQGLKMDAVCFLYRPPTQILSQRLNDKLRSRIAINLNELGELQERALTRFTTTFSHGKTKTAVLTDNHLLNFSLFLQSIC
jgi:adenylate kinase